MNNEAFNKIAYGLYVLTAKEGKHNGYIINTIMQVASSPDAIATARSKTNFTHDIILETHAYNSHYIHVNTKQNTIENKTGYIFKSCANIYKGETLPLDIICPICKNEAADLKKKNNRPEWNYSINYKL